MGRCNESIVDKWLEDDKLFLITCWAQDGMTESDIAKRIGIGLSTFNMWKRKYSDIKQALSKGKEVIDYRVENALLKSALGYKTKKSKVIMELNGRGEMVTTRREVSTEEVPPNVNAIQMWLINRNPKKWQRNRDNSLLSLNDKESNITVNIIRKPKNDEQKDVFEEDGAQKVKKKSKNKKNDDYGKQEKVYTDLTEDEQAWLEEE